MAKDKYSPTLNRPGSVYIDISTILITIMLIAIGLISIYSATFVYTSALDAGMSGTFSRQIMAGGIGLVLMFSIMYIPERIIQMNSIVVYALSLVLLIAVLIFGKETYGTKGWLNLFGFSVQPAEFAKLATVLAVAQHMARKGTDIRTIRDFGIVAAMVLIPVGLIFLQPDMGSATVLMVLFLGVLYWTGFDMFLIFSIVSIPAIMFSSFYGTLPMIIVTVVLSLAAFMFRRKVFLTILFVGMFWLAGNMTPVIISKLEPHQQDRIATFINPDHDPRGKGYNVIQSKMAVGSGGLTGKGFMKGTQTQLRYIPKQWTDFIYSVPTEEFGFVGGVSVILLLSGLIFRSIRIGTETDSPYSSVVAIGIGTIWIYHTTINIGMAIGLMPVMGIPLPFLSAGGTSLMVNMAMTGLLLNFYRTKRIKR